MIFDNSVNDNGFRLTAGHGVLSRRSARPLPARRIFPCFFSSARTLCKTSNSSFSRRNTGLTVLLFGSKHEKINVHKWKQIVIRHTKSKIAKQ